MATISVSTVDSQLTELSELESKLLYAWRFTGNQFVFLQPSHVRLMTRDIFLNGTLAVTVLTP
jgi:hypothetical protein